MCCGVIRCDKFYSLGLVEPSKSCFMDKFYEMFFENASMWGCLIHESIFHCHSLLVKRQHWRRFTGWDLIKFSYRFFVRISPYTRIFGDFSFVFSFQANTYAHITITWCASSSTMDTHFRMYEKRSTNQENNCIKSGKQSQQSAL